MSKPRPIVAGRVYMVTRRIAQRMFLLRPSDEVNGAVRYCLALAAKRTGIDLHVVVVLSNHYHLVLSDPQARLPEFTSYFNGLLARCLNCHHGRWEGFWAASQQPSYVTLENEQAVLAKTVYALLNPVTAGLVKDFRDWPGELLIQPGQYKAVKPDFFFRPSDDEKMPRGNTSTKSKKKTSSRTGADSTSKSGKKTSSRTGADSTSKSGAPLPHKVTLTLTAPPVAAEYRDRMPLIYDVAKAFAAQIVARRKRLGLGFAGAAAVRRQSPFASPTSSAPRRQLNPLIACRDKWARVEAIARNQDFVKRHERCRQRWLNNERDIPWPVGTYEMRRVHNVPIHGAPPAGP